MSSSSQTFLEENHRLREQISSMKEVSVKLENVKLKAYIGYLFFTDRVYIYISRNTRNRWKLPWII